jgi:hypothetical protein
VSTSKTRPPTPAALKKIREHIAKRNEAFEAMTPEKKRVTVAKDVLKQLDTGRLKAKHGTFLQLNGNVDAIFKAQDEGEDLAVALTQVPTCTACALGALFSCTVERADEYGSDIRFSYGLDFKSGGGKYLLQFFDSAQLALIEYAFERGTGYMDEGDGWMAGRASFYLTSDQRNSGLAFAKGVKGTKRMRLIMENIIANKGTFDPSTGPGAPAKKGTSNAA